MNNMWNNPNYNQMSTPYQIPQQVQYPVQQKGITSVALISGEEAVPNYPVAAGNTAVLMDFTAMKFWLKTTDVYGRPLPVESYQFSPIINQNQQQNQNEYVKKEDFDTLVNTVLNLCKELGVDKNVQPK